MSTTRRNFFSAPDRGAKYCDECVCLSVSDHIFRNTYPICTSFFCECYQLLLARPTSGGVVIRYVLSVFIDDVICAQKPRLLDVVDQLKHSAQAALGLAINCAQYY